MPNFGAKRLNIHYAQINIPTCDCLMALLKYAVKIVKCTIRHTTGISVFLVIRHPLSTSAEGNQIHQQILQSQSETIYHISRPIRRTLIFSLEILEKIVMNVF
jgi:hypothetical protein